MPVRRSRRHEEIDGEILRWVDSVWVEFGDADISENVASIRKRPVNSRGGLQKIRREALMIGLFAARRECPLFQYCVEKLGN